MANIRIKLNVGGTIFETYKDTLVYGSVYFRNLLGGQYADYNPELSATDPDIFIDRDPEAFRAILNYLRDPHSVYPYQFRAELDYFGVVYDRQSLPPTHISDLSNLLTKTDIYTTSHHLGNYNIELVCNFDNISHRSQPSIYYQNFLKNVLNYQYPQISGRCQYLSTTTNQRLEGLAYVIDSMCDLIMGIQLIIRLDPNQFYGNISDNFRYQLFSSLKFYCHNLMVSEIDQTLLELLEHLTLSSTQRQFYHRLDQRGEIIIQLPFWINSEHPMSLLARIQSTTDFLPQIVLDNSKIPPNSEIKLCLDGCYLDSHERRKTATHEIEHKDIRQYIPQHRLQNWVKFELNLNIGDQTGNLITDLKCILTSIIIVIQSQNGSYLPIDLIQINYYNHMYFNGTGNSLLAQMAHENIFPTINVYRLNFISNLTLQTSTSLQIQIDQHHPILDNSRLLVYCERDQSLMFTGSNQVELVDGVQIIDKKYRI